MKMKSSSLRMNILIEMVDTSSIKWWGPTLDAMYLIPLREEELSKVGSVLSCDASNECFFHKIYRKELETSS